jgi:hypothetical protein
MPIMTPSAAMPAIDIVRPERMAMPTAMKIAAMMVITVKAPAVVIAVVLREGRPRQQRRKSGSSQHRTESTKSHP